MTSRLASSRERTPIAGANLRACGFTLIELLVVMAVIGVLISILLPSLSGARRQARKAVCLSNVRQLAIANQIYAGANRDHYVPAAMDINIGFGGRNRWHGQRASAQADPDPEKNLFDPLKGPLADILSDGLVKRCPSFPPHEYVSEGVAAFEAGCGGYGYNNRGVGSQVYLHASQFSPDQLMAEYVSGMPASYIAKPSETIEFSDAAMIGGPSGATLFEYSFSEAPFWVGDGGSGQPIEWSDWFADPSMHFRHIGRTVTVAWVDAHASTERFGWSIDRPNIYGGDSRRFNLGWFGGRNNKLFDPH